MPTVRLPNVRVLAFALAAAATLGRAFPAPAAEVGECLGRSDRSLCLADAALDVAMQQLAPDRRVEQVAAVGRLLVVAGRRTEGQAVLARAVVMAASVPASLRDQVHAALASSYAAAGDFEMALRQAEQIGAADRRAAAICWVILAALDAGRTDLVARLIPQADAFWQVVFTAGLSEAYAAAGNWQSAFAAARSIRSDRDESATLARPLAESLAAAGRVEEARTEWFAADPMVRDYAEVGIAFGLLSRGYVAGARRAVALVADRYVGGQAMNAIGAALVRGGDLDAAETVAADLLLKDERDELLSAVAAARTRNGVRPGRWPWRHGPRAEPGIACSKPSRAPRRNREVICRRLSRPARSATAATAAIGRSPSARWRQRCSTAATAPAPCWCSMNSSGISRSRSRSI